MESSVARLIIFSLLVLPSGCKRAPQTVQAAAETTNVSNSPELVSREIDGELMRVDMKTELIQMRVENGMVQTFKFTKDTTVDGLPKPDIKSLKGKEGSELAVTWEGDGDLKVASHIEVTQISSSKARRGRRR